MDNLDDSENNAKISDSAYSNSCSNSQSRRSHSSKSTRSGSNSSGSSGYGGKPSTYSDNIVQPGEKRIKDKNGKNKKPEQLEKVTSQVVTKVEESIAEQAPPPAAASPEDCADNVKHASPPPQTPQVEKIPEKMEIVAVDRISTNDEVVSCGTPLFAVSANYVTSRAASTTDADADGFSCVISMHDGVVMYTSSSITATLGYPQDMWVGRSFIDFVHPRDRNTFASHITSGLALPKNVNATLEDDPSNLHSVYTTVCRIRRCRNLDKGYGVKDRMVSFMPFLLKLSFKNICDEDGKAIYLVIQATPFFSAFKNPHEVLIKPIPFVIRHAANGNMEYIDPESVPYLGYLPQDLAETDALQLYHVEDLPYLRQIYETIVKEGGVPRCRPYRMIAQNGDSLKVETEWSSFINPWSKKLEFVIGKHLIIQGPANPDVFQSPPENGKSGKVPDEEKIKAQSLRESIIRVMNEVATKPAEVAKEQMTKRCHDLAIFMETLIEEQPKIEEELRLEIQDADNSYYERDSVMLGGISPHHDHNDSKSSTETPLSYNQLNYNDNLQRYFKSHKPYSYEDYNTVSGENILGLKNFNPVTGDCLSPVAINSGDSAEMSTCESGVTIGGSSRDGPAGDYMRTRLTESVLNKHNQVMEKELMKIHRETRSSSKGERQKVVIETRLKKKQHLERCNAAFQPTSAGATDRVAKPHGTKRPSKLSQAEGAHKHHCASARLSRRRMSSSAAPPIPSATITSNMANQQWPANTMNTFILGVGISPQMSLMGHMGPIPGMFPMYYAPAATPPGASEADVHGANHGGVFQTHVPCMMYGQAMYGSPFVYSPIGAPMAYPLPQNPLPQTAQTTPIVQPLSLANSNYEEACKQGIPTSKSHGTGSSLRREKMLAGQAHCSAARLGSGDSSCSSTLHRSSDTMATRAPSINGKKGTEETVDRTDGESSYSSFYSSFFKTESGSAEESGDAKKAIDIRLKPATTTTTRAKFHYEPPKMKKMGKRKIEPPWMEQVCVTSELVYKYQVLTKSVEEVLAADKLKMSTLEQPSLVNEQLGQLYLDLQLEGVASRLTLEEGITTCSSSSEEDSIKGPTKVSRKREYSRLTMIYEEEAPLPPPCPVETPSVPSTSTTA